MYYTRKENKMKENIKKLLESKEISNYRISKDTGIAQTTLSDYASGKSDIGNMKLDHAIKLNQYWEEINMTNKIKEAIEYGLNEDLIKSLTEEETIDAAIEKLAEMYEGSELTVEQFVFEKAEEVGIVRDAEEYDDNDEANADGYYWFDEVSKWIMLD